MTENSLTKTDPEERLLTRSEFQDLADVPPEVEWFANLENANTRRAYQKDIRDFMEFVGIARPEDFRIVRRAHVIAWRNEIKRRDLGASTARRKLSALSSLMDYLCDQNAINENPVSGVRRPSEGSNMSKTPTLSADQARLLLDAPDPDTLKGKRDRAILACLLYHALRRSELCGLKVKDFAPRQGVPQLSVLGKGSKTRFIPIAPAAVAPIEDYLDAADLREDLDGPLFRPMAGKSGLLGVRKHLDPCNLYEDVVLRYARDAGIMAPGVRPHALRKTAATEALEHEADLKRVQTWLGHASLATTQLYDGRGERLEESPSFKVAY